MEMNLVRVDCLRARGVFFFMVWIVSMGLSGCAPLPQPSQEVEPAKPVPAADVMLYEEALQNFRAGEYDEALADFDALKNVARSDRYARMAAYGSACMRLILARSAEEFHEALKQWEAWGGRDAVTDSEDPRLLWPLVQRIAGALTLAEADSEKTLKSRKRPSPNIELVNKDLAAYKSQVQAKEKESERLKTRLEAKDREIRRLKQQIESLEAIHLKFQERQKETSSP
jgi:hypothetical protein